MMRSSLVRLYLAIGVSAAAASAGSYAAYLLTRNDLATWLTPLAILAISGSLIFRSWQREAPRAGSERQGALDVRLRPFAAYLTICIATVYLEVRVYTATGNRLLEVLVALAGVALLAVCSRIAGVPPFPGDARSRSHWRAAAWAQLVTIPIFTLNLCIMLSDRHLKADGFGPPVFDYLIALNLTLVLLFSAEAPRLIARLQRTNEPTPTSIPN